MESNTDDQYHVPKQVELFIPSKQFDYKRFDEIILQLIPLSWRVLFDDYEQELRDAGHVIAKKVEFNGHKICPQPWDIFRALALTPPWSVKVVILGQDPYYQYDNNKPTATGCSFECRKGEPIRKSLENLFMVLKKTVAGFEMPEHGDLTSWAQQGVLLLNATPTTTANETNAHVDIWDFYSKRILEYLAKTQTGVVYMLWGLDARRKIKSIAVRKNLVLEASHPVAIGKANTFLKCDHFNEANKYLVEMKKTPIDWRLI